MAQISANSGQRRSVGITFLAIVNLVALVFRLLFWGIVYIRRLVPFPAELISLADRANSAVTYGFMIGDIYYAAPLLLLAWLGLWKLKSWGWMTAQMVNALWVYSMTVISLRDAYTTMTSGALLFLPFSFVAVWAIPYLWINRRKFGVMD
jgi:hypothetical protein